MSKNVSSISVLVNRAPNSPGCYLWKSMQGEILYVGKAVNLRARLRNYLNPETIKTARLMRLASDVEWIVTENGSEALLLESNLIKKNQPRFNVRLKDDKNYPYICVSTSEPFPRVFITRNHADNGNRYFGPYTDVRSTRNMLALIHRIFPVRKRPLKLPLKKPGKPCMNFHIKRCLGPCAGNIREEEYAKIIDEIILFLEGRREMLETRLRERMLRFSDQMEYEHATIYRDMLASIRRSTENKSLLEPGVGNEDIIVSAEKDGDGQIVLLEIRDGRLLDRKSFSLQGTKDATEDEILASFLRDYYVQADFIPERIILPSAINEKNTIQEYLENRIGRKIKIGPGSNSQHRSMIRIAKRNADLLLSERLLSAKVSGRDKSLEDIKKMLGLTKIPEIIECYDISHFQGSFPVASGVCFVDGVSKPSLYRRYSIKYVEGINDPGMIREVIARRIQKLLNEDAAIPDLILIDGGSTQLQSACEAASALGVTDVVIVSLAKKREEIYLPGKNSPEQFSPDRPGMMLLRQIRDEAHRFGVNYHRQKRNRALLKHLVEIIPDVGHERSRALQKHFKEKKIEEAGVEELRSVVGIGRTLAEKIFLFFHPEKSS